VRCLVALTCETVISLGGGVGIVLPGALLAPHQDERTHLNKGKGCSFGKRSPCHHTTSGHCISCAQQCMSICTDSWSSPASRLSSALSTCRTPWISACLPQSAWHAGLCGRAWRAARSRGTLQQKQRAAFWYTAKTLCWVLHL